MGATWPRDRWLAAEDECEDLTPAERTVMAKLAKLAGSRSTVFMSYTELRRRTGIGSNRDVARVLRSLVGKGWLAVVEKGKGRKASTYRMIVPEPRSATTVVALDDPVARPLRDQIGPVARPSGSRSATTVVAQSSVLQSSEQSSSAREPSEPPPADDVAESQADEEDLPEEIKKKNRDRLAALVRDGAKAFDIGPAVDDLAAIAAEELAKRRPRKTAELRADRRWGQGAVDHFRAPNAAYLRKCIRTAPDHVITDLVPSPQPPRYRPEGHDHG